MNKVLQNLLYSKQFPTEEVVWMKKLSAFTVAATFAGCFLGAGYVSGQEILQFFGSHGENWVLGLLVAVTFQFLLGTVILLLSKSTGNVSMDRIVVKWNIPWLRNAMGVLLTLFLFTINVTMFAGFGAMLQQLTALPAFAGSVLLAALVTCLALLGLRGMVAAFSLFVPILSVTAVVICIAALTKYGIKPVQPAGSNALLGGWAISAMTFVSFNIFGSIGMLTPMGQFVRKNRTVYLGIALGSVVLTVIAAGIVLAMNAYPESLTAELPMLAVASGLSPVFGAVYAVMLFGGMLGTALAGTVAIDIYLQQKLPAAKYKRRWMLPLLSLLGLVCSGVGFSDLVGTVYPIFGYCGLASIFCIFCHFFSICRKRRKIPDHA